VSLTPEELHVSDLICVAYNAFAALPPQHPDELRDVADAVHRWQDILGMRCARACHPDVFPVKDAAWVEAHRAVRAP
jgi:hypothetical protein